VIAAPAGFVVPPATRSLVVVGLGPAADPQVFGWTAGVPLPSATDGILVAAGAVVDAVGRVPERGVAPLRSGWVAPAALVAGESAVVTTFAAPIVAVAVALDGGTGDDLALGLHGAQRPVAADGTPEAPLLVADRGRAVLVYRLTQSAPGTAVTVITGATRRLAGVVAVPAEPSAKGDPARVLADAVARRGLEALVPPVAEPGSVGAELGWKES
jgi:hypothetical protein